MGYWLMKSEPDVFGIDDLAKKPRKRRIGTAGNFQARLMRDGMRRGDLAFFITGIATSPASPASSRSSIKKVIRTARAFDANDPHFDAGSDLNKPRWYMVDVQLQRKFRRTITLAALREHENRALKGLRTAQARQSFVGYAGERGALEIHCRSRVVVSNARELVRIRRTRMCNQSHSVVATRAINMRKNF